MGLDGYVRYILGVKPLTAQFDQVQIKPLDFGNSLATASGTVPTDRGTISVEWDRSATQYHLAVTIPVNVTATVYVPQLTITNTIVTVNGVNVVGTVTNGYLGVSGIGSGAHNIESAIVMSPPVVSFNGGPTNGAAPLTVTFTNLSGNATNYVWSFGDGNTISTSSSTNVTDTYTNVGSYTVSLMATGPAGTNSLTNTAYIVVTPPLPPVTGFNGGSTNGAAPLKVTFTNLSSNATNYVWNFGDGNTFSTSSKTNVTDIYMNVGSYTVSLMATGPAGTNSLTNTAYVVVTPPQPPVAGFDGTPTAGAAPLTVTFTNLSSNATNYVWNFGDGNTFSTSSGINVTDTYTNVGSYTVSLMATGPAGTNSLTNTAYIVVINPPPVQIITNADNGGNLTVGASWNGGVAPGWSDVAVFDSTITSGHPAYATNVLGADTTWGEIQILNPALPVQISAGNTLTLNGLNSLGVDMSRAANALTLNCPVALGAS